MGWGSIGSSIFGSILRYKGTRDTNKANSAQALRQMQFQEKMAKSAHQNEVADLKKAGLNPILSGTGGSGAASPPGASAKMLDEGGPVAEGAVTAVQLAQMKSQTHKIDAETKLLGLQVPEGEASAEVYSSMLGTGLKGKQALGRVGTAWRNPFSAKTINGKKYPWWKSPTTPMLKNANRLKKSGIKKPWTNEQLNKRHFK